VRIGSIMAGHSLSAQGLTSLDHYVRDEPNVPFDEFLMKGCDQLVAMMLGKRIRSMDTWSKNQDQSFPEF
jgi:hypothetical protein